MKRSALQRKPWQPRPAKVWGADTLPTPRVAVLRRVVNETATALIKPRPKERPWRCEEYRRIVSTMRCAHCARLPPSQCAHSDEGKGMGTKASDETCFPLCADSVGRKGCHSYLGASGLFKREHRRRPRGAKSLCEESLRGKQVEIQPPAKTRRSGHERAEGHDDHDPREGARRAMNMHDELAAHLAQEQADTLDDLLIRWHHWQGSSTTTRGYAPRSLVCGEYRVSRQYDDANGALDDAIDAKRSAAVDFAVVGMSDPWRAAIYVEARNLVTGVAVWNNPRLPADVGERRAVVVDARCMLVRRLQSAGVM